MRGQAGFFDVDERLKRLSANGDSLEQLSAVIDFELFRADLVRAMPRSDRAKGGPPAPSAWSEREPRSALPTSCTTCSE
jgi:transposase, IS5 family